MKKDKVIRNILIIVTIIALIIDSLLHTNQIYSCNLDTMKLNKILISLPFTIILYSDYILIYIISIWYAILSIKSKKEVGLKIAFCLISIFIATKWVVINTIAEIFGIF